MMTPEYVADCTIDAILRELSIVIIPKTLYFMYAVKGSVLCAYFLPVIVPKLQYSSETDDITLYGWTVLEQPMIKEVMRLKKHTYP